MPEDYVFQAQARSGEPADVRFSELFASVKDSLVIYSMMFPRLDDDDRLGPRGGQTALLPLAESPCPSCTAFLDQLDGAAEHVSQRVNLAVVGKAPIGRITAFAEERGWRRLRLLSRLATPITATTGRRPGRRPATNAERVPPRRLRNRHFWGSELFYAPEDPEQDPHVGTLEPLWNLFDLTPEGRGTDWFEQMNY